MLYIKSPRLCKIIGIIKFSIIINIIIVNIYVVNMLNPLACLLKKFLFFVVLYAISIFLHGKYNMYDIKIPTKNGISILNIPLNHIVIFPKLSNIFHIATIANAIEK